MQKKSSEKSLNVLVPAPVLSPSVALSWPFVEQVYKHWRVQRSSCPLLMETLCPLSDRVILCHDVLSLHDQTPVFYEKYVFFFLFFETQVEDIVKDHVSKSPSLCHGYRTLEILNAGLITSKIIFSDSYIC